MINVIKFNMKINYVLLQLFLCIITVLNYVQPDPDPLQDYCVAETRNTRNLFHNGQPCINPDLAIASHFATSALSKSGSTGNQFGFNVTLTNINNLPGLNTQGLVMGRIDIAANGLIPPHSHPRASEVTILLKGSLLVGFVDTTNRLYTQQLRPGDSFVFPKGLIHFLYNIDPVNAALAVSGLSSQNPGAQISSMATFVSKPPIPDEILKKGFKINNQDVMRIRRNLGG